MDRLWTNARIATLTGDGLGLIERGAIAVRDGRIAWVGDAGDAPEAADIVDCEGRLITPGLIDCHTHLVHGGSRANEWAMRLEGATYEEIARAGGGIVSTMRATRAMDGAALVESALPRLDALISEGVTTIEIKSGYGLTPDDELKMIYAILALEDRRKICVVPTFLGAHAVPPEFRDNVDGYVEQVCHEMIPAVSDLAYAVDGFCETIGFTPEQISRVFDAATAFGLRVKLHAEQLSNQNGAALAARHNALSADHLEHLDDAGVAAMAEAGTVAVLLPGAYYFMRETKTPPVAALREAKVPIALATDCNPGTSPVTSLLLILNMGATLFGLSVNECIRAVTVNAAKALGLNHMIGTLESGKAADLAIWNITEPAELVYRIGFNPLHARIKDGQCN